MLQLVREAPGEFDDSALLFALRNFASVSLQGGRYNEAEKAFREALVLSRSKSRETPYSILSGLNLSLEGQGRYDEARQLLESEGVDEGDFEEYSRQLEKKIERGRRTIEILREELDLD